jgi:ribosome biogenesis SPOUT family RNA methylase Rps3
VYKPSITIERTKIAESADSELELDRLAALEAIRLDETYLSSVEVEDRRAVEVNGQTGIQLRYQYATEDDGRPALRTGVVTLVRVGGYVYSIRYEAEPEHFETDLPDYEAVLSTVRFMGTE